MMLDLLGNENIVVNLYYNDEFITTIVRHQLNPFIYYINGLLNKISKRKKSKNKFPF